MELKEISWQPKKTYITHEKKIVTGTKKWIDSCFSFHRENQLAILSHLHKGGEEQNLVKKQILIKRLGYKGQDMTKKIFSPKHFISLETILQLLVASNLSCFYCHENILLFYESTRDPKQWTLDRIDNTLGHNNDNVLIACLKCNVRRKCLASQKYLRAKEQMIVCKLKGTTYTEGATASRWGAVGTFPLDPSFCDSRLDIESENTSKAKEQMVVCKLDEKGNDCSLA